MTEFLLIRHATTDAADRFYAGRMAGVGLNERGRRDAAALARRLENVTIDAIYSSPIDRCFETAEMIAELQDVEVSVDEAFTEIDTGEWTGRTFDELRRDETFGRFNTFRSGTRPPGGEVTVEIQARMVAGILRLAERHPHQTVAVVGHADPIQSLLTYFLGMPVDLGYRLAIDPASVSVLEMSETGARVTAVNHKGPLGMLEI
jgi:probable phosphomutase (TIGR03848 family)